MNCVGFKNVRIKGEGPLFRSSYDMFPMYFVGVVKFILGGKIIYIFHTSIFNILLKKWFSLDNTLVMSDKIIFI